MRKIISRGRGRPRGGYRSHVDIKILEYLALIAMKYGVDPSEFFNSLIDARKNKEAICGNLVITCRKSTEDSIVFLITNGYKVVAQFPIPKHILEGPSPLEDFLRAMARRNTTLKNTEVKNPRIGDLRSGMKRRNLKAKVLEVPKPRSVITRSGRSAKVTNAIITDETGNIQLTLWNEQIDEVSVGDVIQVEKARVVTFRGERQLRVGRSGQLSVIEKVH